MLTKLSTKTSLLSSKNLPPRCQSSFRPITKTTPTEIFRLTNILTSSMMARLWFLLRAMVPQAMRTRTTWNLFLPRYLESRRHHQSPSPPTQPPTMPTYLSHRPLPRQHHHPIVCLSSGQTPKHSPERSNVLVSATGKLLTPCLHSFSVTSVTFHRVRSMI